MVQEACISGLLWPAKVTPFGVNLAGQSKHVCQSNPFGVTLAKGVTLAGQGVTKITPADQVCYSNIIS